MGTQGNLEDVKSAAFIRQEESAEAVFENSAGLDGLIMATADGEYRTVADDINLAVGAGWDGRISRSIVSFDISSLPQRVTITRAYLQVQQRAGFGRPWDDSEWNMSINRGSRKIEHPGLIYRPGSTSHWPNHRRSKTYFHPAA